MPTLCIEIATALVGREPRGDRVMETQVLELEGWSDGRPGRACLIFSAAVEPARTAPVGYVTEDGGGGIGLVGWLPEHAYPIYRRILAKGGALKLHFETRNPTSGYLRRLALGRGAKALVATSPGVAAPAEWPERPRAMAYAMPL
jgi:hypothetical protein